MLSKAVLLAVAMRFAVVDQEAHDSKLDRLAVLATATDDVIEAGNWPLSKDALKAATMATMIEESARLSLGVHTGEVRGDHGNSICLGQINKNNKFADVWGALAGTAYTNTHACVKAVARTLVHSYNYCYARKYRKNWQRAMFTLYATGNRCWFWKGSRSRADLANRIQRGKWVVTEEMENALIRVVRDLPSSPSSPN